MVELGYTVDGPKRRKQSPMNMEEIVNKIGRANLKKAVESDDAGAFKELVEQSGFELNEEQLEAIAGGMHSDSDCVCYSFDAGC